MKEMKVKCELCPRNKQYSKRTQLHKCVCCDVNEATCKHRHGTQHEKQVKEKKRINEIKWPVWNPFTNEVEMMTPIRQSKIFFLYTIAMNVFEKRMITSEYLQGSPIMEGKGVSTNDEDLRKGIQEKEYVWTWRKENDY